MLSGQTAVARCPHCRYPFTIAAEHLGTAATCDKCHNAFTLTADEAVGRIGPRPRIPGEKRRAPARKMAASAAAAPVGVAVGTAGVDDGLQLVEDEADLVDLAQAAVAERIPLSSFPPPRLPAGSPATAPPQLPIWTADMPGRRPSAPPAKGPSRGFGRERLYWTIGTVLCVLLGVGLIVGKVAKRQSSWRGAAAPVASVPSGPPPKLSFSDDAAGRRVGNVVVTGRRSASTEVRLVLPPGEHADRSLPCVFVCPAGSNLLVGVPFGDGEREDFYPLLDRGVAVCFYSLDGTVPDLQNASERQLLAAIEPYMKSDGGMANLSDAMDTVLASSPHIDPARLGTAGHSSAGTIAIMAAAREPRVRAVAAMAPATDLPRRLAEVARADRRLGEFIRRISPSEIDALACPVWIFHANDDDNVPIRETWEFELKHTGQVSVRAADSGGHAGAYHQGLPEAVDFLATTLNARPPGRSAPNP